MKIPPFVNKILHGWSLDLRSLSLFRVGLAIVIIADLILRARYLVEHYTDAGIYPLSVWQELGTGEYRWSLYRISGSTWYVTSLFIVEGLAAAALIVGYQTRWSLLIIWILTISLQNRNTMITSGADDLLRMTIFWAMFLPLDRYWSWTSHRYLGKNRTSIVSLATIAYIMQIFALYWVTAYLKLGDAWYGRESAVAEILSLETFRVGGESLLSHHPWIMQMITKFSMWVEFLAPIAIVMPFFRQQIRMGGIWAIIFLHIGIITHINVGIFPWVSMVGVIACLPETFWEKVKKITQPREKITLYYDSRCGLCVRWIQILQNYGLFQRVLYTPLSEAPQSIRKISDDNEAWVSQRGNKISIGYDGFTTLCRQSYLLRFYSYLGDIPPLRQIGHSIYRAMSRMRQYCSLPRKQKPIETPHWERRISRLLCAVALLIVTMINLGVSICGNGWSNFVTLWPTSLIETVYERGLHFGEKIQCTAGQLRNCTVIRGGWTGHNMTAPRKPALCSQTTIETPNILERGILPIQRSLLSIAYIFRLNQYWGMFAPDPINRDYWVTVESTRKSGEDLWKSYALGHGGKIDQTKPTNLHAISLSDRWRKFVSNLAIYKNDTYYRYFGEYWCRAKDETITVTLLSQISKPESKQSGIEKIHEQKIVCSNR